MGEGDRRKATGYVNKWKTIQFRVAMKKKQNKNSSSHLKEIPFLLTTKYSGRKGGGKKTDPKAGETLLLTDKRRSGGQNLLCPQCISRKVFTHIF